MSIRRVTAMGTILVALLVTPVLAGSAGRTIRSDGINADADLTFTCRSMRTAPKPFLEIVEDGIAYLLDIPLAMLSPLMCPIVAPLMEYFDSGPDRSYDGRARR